jgi:hypothetical protein
LHCWRRDPIVQCHPLPQAIHELNTRPGNRHPRSLYLLRFGVLLKAYALWKPSPVHVPHFSNPNGSSRTRVELATPPQALAVAATRPSARSSLHRRPRPAADAEFLRTVEDLSAPFFLFFSLWFPHATLPMFRRESSPSHVPSSLCLRPQTSPWWARHDLRSVPVFSPRWIVARRP